MTEKRSFVLNIVMVNIASLVLLLLLSVSVSALPRAQVTTDVKPEASVFRDPFTLKLQVDKDHFYEERFDKIPYVAGHDVYLFVGENFGVKVTSMNDEISQITYEQDPAKADIAFKFTQEATGGKPMTILEIQNRLKRRLFLDALMTVPNKKGIYKTSILPVEKGLIGFESWPHPIVQLVLRNLRFSQQPAHAPKDSTSAQPGPGI
jgi:hypothetical protein